MKVSESNGVRIKKHQNWKESETARFGKCQNGKVSEMARIGMLHFFIDFFRLKVIPLAPITGDPIVVEGEAYLAHFSKESKLTQLLYIIYYIVVVSVC